MTLRTNGRPGRRHVEAVLGAVLVLALTACSSDAQDDPTPQPTASEPGPLSEPSEPSPTPSAPDDEAQILAAFEGFWAARVATQQGNLEPALFDGFATGSLVEEDMAVARNLAQYGFVREGQPGFADISVSVDGERALVSSCVDYTTWVVPEAEGDAASVNPVGVVVEHIDGTWLVTDVTEAAAGLTC